MSGVMVAWMDHHGRSQALAELLDLEPVFMPWARPGQAMHKTVAGWFRSAARTVSSVRGAPHGSLVVVQAPPVFAPLVAKAAAGRSRAVVVDLHSGAFNDARWRWSHPLMRRISRSCDAAIVTNTELVRIAGGELGEVLRLHDPLTDRRQDAGVSTPASARPYVVFPASGAADEPMDAVAEAAGLLAPDVDLTVTGDNGARFIGTRVHATGYLDAAEFDDVMRGAAAVLALTTRPATMQRAAYEALERGVPIVSSRTDALERALGDAAVYTEPSGAAIAAAVRVVLADPDRWRDAGTKVLAAMVAESQTVADRLRALAADRAMSSGYRNRTR